MKHLFFDMDGTLTESRQEITDEMLQAIQELKEYPLVISGAQSSQMYKQLRGAKVVSLSQNGNKTPLWQNILSDTQKSAILSWIGDVPQDMIEDRGCQISLSMTGHNAPLADKKAYDPDGSKRTQILAEKPFNVEGVQVKVAGTTCFDFFVKTKGENISSLLSCFGWDPKDCLYVGDALYPGGNDDSMIGVMETRQVSGPKETLEIIKSI